MFRKLNKIILVLIFLTAFLAGNHVSATDFKALMDAYLEGGLIDHDKGPGAEIVDERTQDNLGFFYDKPTAVNFSHMYWKLGLYDYTNDWAIDEFMRMNECSIYQRFFGNEFEWTKVRDATRVFLKKNRDDFPTRFEFVMPIRLQDYDEKYGTFELQDDFKIRSIRRFQLSASDIGSNNCVNDFKVQNGYPGVLNMEFSRPFDLERIPVRDDLAKAFIEEKNRELVEKYPPLARTESQKYELREVYAFLRLKVYSVGQIYPSGLDGRPPSVQILGVMEGFSVYADISRKTLFYEQNFTRDQTAGKLNVKLGDQYDELKEKSGSGGILQ
ncbi:MAG: DUF4852 domain-containing protein [Alphaproteobacteria bacterium]|nr:DUF4852 domain-containing protein [Alphaproteobacteria bacterium]